MAPTPKPPVAPDAEAFDDEDFAEEYPADLQFDPATDAAQSTPDGKAQGHIAAVVGEYAPGVPAIAQAGRNTFSWGPVTASKPNPTYFVRE